MVPDLEPLARQVLERLDQPARVLLLDRPRLERRAPLVPLPRFGRQGVTDAIAEHRPTVFIGVPFHFVMLARAPLGGGTRWDSLRWCVSASAPMPLEAGRAFHDRFGHPVRQLYGSTETGTISVNLDPDPTGSMATVGRPLPGVEVEVLREDGTPADPGDMGEFAIRSPAAIGRYVDDEEATRASFRDGAFRIGDLGHADEEGGLTIVGRKTSFINKAGYKIEPREVERLIERHPGVEKVVVLGAPTAKGDEKVVAFVVAREPLTSGDIVAQCRGKIAPFKVPSVVDFVDAIPRSPAGKVRRSLLLSS